MPGCVIELSLFNAALAFVWISILIQPDGLFAFFPDMVTSLIKSKKLQYPLIHCEKCLAGQVAFWFGLYLWGNEMITWFEWFQVIVYSILFAAFLAVIYQKLRL